eukprot:4012025-Pyramimonas_sp.AAC.1
MLREGCCCEMGWWGYAKRKEFSLLLFASLGGGKDKGSAQGGCAGTGGKGACFSAPLYPHILSPLAPGV